MLPPSQEILVIAERCRVANVGESRGAANISRVVDGNDTHEAIAGTVSAPDLVDFQRRAHRYTPRHRASNHRPMPGMTLHAR
jgi:hypothetical protein